MSYFGSIYADQELSHRAKTVYMYLKDRSNADGTTGYNPKCNTPKTRRQYALESVECSCYQTSTQR